MTLLRRDGYWEGSFAAMASPCSLLTEAATAAAARRQLDLVRTEAQRIEAKFSRYRDDSVVQRINTAGGRPIEVDDETALLLDYAASCHKLSDGRFDVTSGVLRRAWRFDGSDRLPAQSTVEGLLPHIGWQRTTWDRPRFTLPAGMEIDFGGIGKEYAVDRCAGLLSAGNDASFVLNFGGDLFVSGPRADGGAWRIGVEDPGGAAPAAGAVQLRRGGIATSGDARRFLLKDGVRYGHILDPRTGWPVPHAPHSVTVLADTCLEAGMLATFAMLMGAAAESFLAAQGVKHHVIR